MRKAQVTMFILLGLLLLAASVFVLYLRGAKIGAISKPAQNEVLETILKGTSTKYYVITCLEQETINALELAGMQGGVIYDFQAKGTSKSSISIPFRYNGTVYNVTYAIKYPSEQNYIYSKINRFLLAYNIYPYNGSLISNPEVVDLGVQARVNIGSTLPALCYNYSSNFDKVYGYKLSCEFQSTAMKKKDTVQYYLERYIENKTRECVNFTVIREGGYTIVEGNINVSVMFTEESVFVLLNYPLIINVAGEEPQIHVLAYNTEQKVRFKKIYELADHFAREDMRNIFLDTTNASLIALDDCPGFVGQGESFSRKTKNESCLKSGFNMTLYPDVCHDCSKNSTDVIMIQDKESQIGTKPFAFAFAIENRRPALDFIDKSVNKSTPYFNYVYTRYNHLNLTRLYNNVSYPKIPSSANIVSEDGGQLLIIPFGKDPDDEFLTYRYTGWNTPIAIEKSQGNIYSYINPITGIPINGSSVSGGKHGSENYWQNSKPFNLGIYPFNVKKKDARYPPSPDLLSPSDVGYHWVRINVSDSAGLYDWQDIKIQVRCDPDKECCNKSNFFYIPQFAKCDNCKSCDDLGNCDNDPGAGQRDCAQACQKCSEGKCVNLVFDSKCTGENACCHGICAPKEPPPSKSCGECLQYSCKGVHYTYSVEPVNTPCGPRPTPTSPKSGSCNSIGRCIMKTPSPPKNCYIGLSDSTCIVSSIC